MHRILTRAAMAVALTVVGACGQPLDPIEPAAEEEDDDAGAVDKPSHETISRVWIAVSPVGPGPVQLSSIDDPDGPGPAMPQPPTDTLTLTPGRSYSVGLRFIDIADPVAPNEITWKIENQGTLHRVFPSLTDVTAVSIAQSSLFPDSSGAPLGTSFELTVDSSTTGSGALRVVLSHYEARPKGDGNSPGDRTDADVSFVLRVQ